MLALQKFIMDNANWEELLTAAPYNLHVRVEGDYALFKYNQIASDFREPICREARGVIIYLPRVEVVRLAFFKFFNVDEPYADKLDWSTAHGTEKIDGSIVTLWFYMGEWHLSTNGTIDAYKAEIGGVGPYKTFGDLFDAAAKNVGLDVNSLDEDFMYTFELVSPYNKVVLDYPEPSLYLLSVRVSATLEEVYPVPAALAPSVPRPIEYDLNTEDDYRKAVESMGGGHEGIVVRDAAGRRVKIKTLLYFQLHRTVNNGQLTVERVVALVRANDYEEFLSYFPEYTDYFESVKTKLAEADAELARVQAAVDAWKSANEGAPRKWFAQDVAGKGKVSALYFAAYDGKLDEFVAKLTDDKFIRLFGIE